MRTFLGFGQVPYIGAPFTRAIRLGGSQGQTVPLLFQWLSYGASTARPNVNVLVDIDNAVCRALDQIRSIYIDNLGSDNPVYAFFPDTGYCVVAKPNSEGWYPVFTNSKKLWVIGEGFLTGDIPQTTIILCNLALEANVNNEIDNAVALWRASPTITRGKSIYNSALGIPALGDQIFSSGTIFLNTNSTAALWNTPYPSGFLYVTSLLVNAVLAQNLGGRTSPAFIIESTGVAGPLAQFFFGATEDFPLGVTPIVSLSGLQIKLDATQTWRIRVTSFVSSGFLQCVSTFTQQP